MQEQTDNVARPRIIAGASQAVARDPIAAARNATKKALADAGHVRADLVFLFCADPDVDDPDHLARVVSDTAGGATVIGCSAASVIEGNEEMEGDPAVAVLVAAGEGLRANSILIDGQLDDPRRTATTAADLLERSTDHHGLLITLVDPAAFQPGLLDTLSEEMPDLPIVGGGAAGPEVFVLAEGAAASRGTALALVESIEAPLIAVSQGCQPLGPAMRITRCQGNLVVELDGRPALDVLREMVGSAMSDDLEEIAGMVFAALGATVDGPLEDGYVIRGIVGFEPDMGIVAVGDHVEEGQAMTFALREGVAAREAHDRTVAALAQRLNGRRPAFGLYFDCAGRGRGLYGHRGIDLAYIRRHLGDFPLAGMFSAFELAPTAGQNVVHMFSGVLIVWPG